VFTSQSTTAQLPAGITQIEPEVIVADYPDVLHYGASSGQVANPTSRVQIYGFAAPGRTIDLQVVGARPNVDATFYFSTGHADVQLPGIGWQLIDPTGALLLSTVTDGQGKASISLPIPLNAKAGDEFFVQCETIDTGSPMPAIELSSAAYLEIGSAPRSIGAGSLLAGDIVVIDDGVATKSPTASGILMQEWRPAGNQSPGTLAVHVGVTSLSVNGQNIINLLVQPGVNEDEVVWNSSNFQYVAPGTADAFLVSYEHAGTEYGPYVVSGTISSVIGDVNVDLDPIVSTDGGPLDGAMISLNMDESFVDPQYFDDMPKSLLLEGFGDPRSITPDDVDRLFARAERVVEALLANQESLGFYNAEMPTYEEFVTLEAAHLLALTGGLASNSHEMHEALSVGRISLDEGFDNILVSKLLAALGINDGIAGFADTLKEMCGKLCKKASTQVDAGEYKKAAKTLGKILDKVASKKFAKKLADKIGRKLAGKILAQFASKFVPIIGWAWFISALLWAIIEQWFD
jgi:hypothetical protein